jgi:hypothetical protein
LLLNIFIDNKSKKNFFAIKKIMSDKMTEKNNKKEKFCNLQDGEERERETERERERERERE